MKSTFFYAPIIVFSVISITNCLEKRGSIELDTTSAVPEILLKGLNGSITGTYLFKDKLGSHALLLLRKNKTLKNKLDNISLQAMQFSLKDSSWGQEWIIKDNLLCEGLDLDADFIKSLTRITDLDSNGIAETTVAYHLACLGGIDTKPTKVIMRQGKEKYAIRGESIVKIEGSKPFGGSFVSDKSLDLKPTFKWHLMEIWKIAIEPGKIR